MFKNLEKKVSPLPNKKRDMAKEIVKKNTIAGAVIGSKVKKGIHKLTE